MIWILTLSSVDKRFGDIEVIFDLTFTVEVGLIFGFIGKNGTAKGGYYGKS